MFTSKKSTKRYLETQNQNKKKPFDFELHTTPTRRYLETKSKTCRWRKHPLFFSTLNTAANKEISWNTFPLQKAKNLGDRKTHCLLVCHKREAKISWEISWNKFPACKTKKSGYKTSIIGSNFDYNMFTQNFLQC